MNKLPSFRKTFTFSPKDIAKWYPRHMYKGVKQMQFKLAQVDLIIEVHDARIPFSGRNPYFQSQITAVKPHLLVLNKLDTIDPEFMPIIKDKFMKKGIKNVMFTNCESGEGVSEITPTVIDLIINSERYNRSWVNEYNLMIIGIPNVGKSSLINSLKKRYLGKGGATKVGSTPGVTRSVLFKIKISEEPLIYLLDTPGIFSPNVNNVDTALRLALCNTVDDHLIGVDVIADYLLYWLNKNDNFTYIEYLGLPGPTDDIRELLLRTSFAFKKYKKIRSPEGYLKIVPDFTSSSQYFIRGFRKGYFGKLMLDTDYL